MTNTLSLPQIAFCAEACDRQRDVGPLGVVGMCKAFAAARLMFSPVLIPDVVYLGVLVNPKVNGLRTVPVVFANGNSGMRPEQIMRSLKVLLEEMQTADTQLTPVEFYKYFQEIHPFVDGNGRVGAILFNYFNQTMDNPVHPPDIFGNPS